MEEMTFPYAVKILFDYECNSVLFIFNKYKNVSWQILSLTKTIRIFSKKNYFGLV